MTEEEREKLQNIIDKYKSTYSLRKYKLRDRKEHTDEFIRLVEYQFRNTIGDLRFSEMEPEIHTRVVLASNDI